MTEPQDPFAVPDQPSGQHNPGSYPPPPPAPAYDQPLYPPGAKTNTLAIIALIAAFICSPAGLIMGIIARNQIKQNREGGSGLALAAIIIGAISLAIGILVVLGAVLAGGPASNSPGY